MGKRMLNSIGFQNSTLHPDQICRQMKSDGLPKPKISAKKGIDN